MVRGLDYYMRTTFEITHGALGAQNSVLGGGRYDGLAEALGSKVPAPGIGFSIGEDRLVMSVEEAHPEAQQPAVDVFLAPLGEAAEQHAGALAAELRGAGISVERSVDRKLKRALEVANKMGARFALILGDDEIAAGTYLMKDMASGEQVSLSREATRRTHTEKLEHGIRTSRFFRRPAPHAHLRRAARLRCRQESAADGLGASPPRSGRRAVHPSARPRRRHAARVPRRRRSDVHAKAEMLASEYVIAVEGTLALRTAETINPAIPTGEVEVVVEKIWI